MATVLTFNTDSEEQTKELAQHLALCVQSLEGSLVIHLEGDLGAGKTTFARGFIQAFGFDRVKSPTYSLVESYNNSTINIHHFDCYRLSDPEELEYIGIREYLNNNHIQLIEWAEMGKGIIADADLIIELTSDNDARSITFTASNSKAEQLQQCISS